MKIIDVTKQDAHDRLEHVKQTQHFGISGVLHKIISEDPFDGRRFYIFAHARKDDDGSSTRVIWQPRLTKPKAQTNSMLFKVDPKKLEEVEVIWIIPPREQWPLYEEGKFFENQIVVESIKSFQSPYGRGNLERKDSDDLEEWQVQEILRHKYPNLFYT